MKGGGAEVEKHLSGAVGGFSTDGRAEGDTRREELRIPRIPL